MQETTHKYQKLTDYWTKCSYLSLSFSLFTFLSGTIFSVLRHRYSAKLNVTSDHLRGTWFFSKLSLAKYHFLHKKPVFTVTSRLQHRYFLVNFGKFVRAPILKKNSEWLHFWKVFCENIFSDRNLAKGNFDDLLYERLKKILRRDILQISVAIS